MGTFKKGILGNFKGKVGTVIGSTWRGKSVMRSLPATSNRKPGPGQLEQQARFSLMIKFLRPLTSLVKETYDTSPAEMSGMNKAFSDNIREAITGVYPDLTVDFSKVSISKGILPNVDNPLAASTVAGKMAFTWTDNSATGDAVATDLAFFVLYNEAMKRWIFKQNSAPRSAGTYTLDVPAFSGKLVQTYIGFVSADGKNVSDSLYTGQVNVL